MRVCRVLLCLGWFGCERARHLWALGAVGLGGGRRQPSGREAPGNTKQTQQWFSRRLWGLSAGWYGGPLCAFVVSPPPPPPGPAGAAPRGGGRARSLYATPPSPPPPPSPPSGFER